MPVTLQQVIVTVAVGLLCAIGGALINRYFQRRGKIIFRVDKWQVVFEAPDSFGQLVEVDPKMAQEAEGRLSVAFWNEKDVRSALHGMKVVFRRGSAQIIECQLYDGHGEFSQVNLPSREWVNLRLTFEISETQFPQLNTSDNVIFVGYTTDMKAIVHKVHEAFRIPTASPPSGRINQIREVIRDRKLESLPSDAKEIADLLNNIYPGEGFTPKEVQDELE